MKNFWFLKNSICKHLSVIFLFISLIIGTLSNSYSQVVINEIMSMDSSSFTVELKNIGSDTVDISTYWLCDFPEYKQINDLESECGDMNLPPGAIYVARSFSDGLPLDGEMGLYTVNNFADSNAIIDYVEWGTSGHQRSIVAQNAGIWLEGDFVTSFTTNGSIEYDGSGNSSSAWEIETIPTICLENPGGPNCTVDAGTLTAVEDSVCFFDSTTISALANNDAIVPIGYITLYLLSEGVNSTIINGALTPEFPIENPGTFIIHTFVFDTLDIDLTYIILGITTVNEIFELTVEGGGINCADFDLDGAQIEAVGPDAGTLTAELINTCLVDSNAIISANPNGDINLPQGYISVYILTEGSELIIQQAQALPEFGVSEIGDYTIHTLVFNPLTFNLGVIEPGITTGFDIYDLIFPGGGDICADFDIVGAPITVVEIFADTLVSSTSFYCYDESGVVISAIPSDGNLVPDGYTILYVLSQGSEFTIIDLAESAEFLVSDTGAYAINTLVLDTNTFDLDLIVFGTTTIGDLFELIAPGGGDICADFNQVGLDVFVFQPLVGTLIIEESNICLTSDNEVFANQNGDISIPPTFDVRYLLAQIPDLTIIDLSEGPTFSILEDGDYSIHTFVYDPAEFDIETIDIGTSTVNEVFEQIIPGGGDICADLDTAGLSITVIEAYADTLTAVEPLFCYDESGVTISAIPSDQSIVPDGYSTLFVLSQGTESTIIDLAESAEFLVNDSGTFTIHTFIVDTNTFEVDLIVLGITTTGDIFELLVPGGGDICADFDLIGLDVYVAQPIAGSLSIEESNICLWPESVASASQNEDISIPQNFEVRYFLAEIPGKTLIAVNAEPSFSVFESGEYSIHTLVYDAATFDLGTVDLGTTTLDEVFAQIVPGGGALCADLDTMGVAFSVIRASAGTLTADTSEFCSPSGEVTISATNNGDVEIPEGYSILYLLTQGDSLLIVNTNLIPEFQVETSGDYTIHTLVFDTLTLDISTINLGVTTANEIFDLTIEGGGTICANLDLIGAAINLSSPYAGTLTTNIESICLIDSSTFISAIPNGDINIPTGFTSIYVLTQGSELIIMQASNAPDFEVVETGLYTIHTLVFNPLTLDLGIIQPGITTGFDVFDLIVPGGGEICADLDITGASINVEAPFADSPTDEVSYYCYDESGIAISAIPSSNNVVPSGYSTIYILSQGEETTIVDVGSTSEFMVSDPGIYMIHTFILDTNTFDLELIITDFTTVTQIFDLIAPGGGNICADLDLNGLEIIVANPIAGTLSIDDINVCLTAESIVSADQNGDISIPPSFAVSYLFAEGSGLIIIELNTQPSFIIPDDGNYSMHAFVYNPMTFDLGDIELGSTTVVDVFGLIIPGGGENCADLDTIGLRFNAVRPMVGTLTAAESQFCTSGEDITLSATPNGDAEVPDGYSITYLLTQGETSIIINSASSPEFSVSDEGIYVIRTLVYDSNTLDLSIIEFGVTTGGELFGIIVPGGGNICADLDTEGALFAVESPYAGTLTAESDRTCLNDMGVNLSATPNGDFNIPPIGYAGLFILTQGEDQVIIQAGNQSEFTVFDPGTYGIHTFVFNPNTFNLNDIEIGVTTIADIYASIVPGGGDICADLDTDGAEFYVEAPNAGTLTPEASSFCAVVEAVSLVALPDGNMAVPEGYSVMYLLSENEDLVFIDINDSPEFELLGSGTYTIHTLIYDTSTLDIDVIVLGTTTGNDIFELTVSGGGTICADLDIEGAVFNLESPLAGTIVALNDGDCLIDGSLEIEGTPGDDMNVPSGYELLYLLSEGEGLVITATSETPSFTITEGGDFTIHTFVFDPNAFSITDIQLGITTAAEVFELIVPGNGIICADLDITGAAFQIVGPKAGLLIATSTSVCLLDGTATISATTSLAEEVFVPEGFSLIYILTRGDELVILEVGNNAEFVVNSEDIYTIHTLVYDSSTLDLDIIEIGVTTGFDINELIVSGGGDICADLDSEGAIVFVGNPDAGTLTSDADIACEVDGNATISATPNGDIHVPDGFTVIYLLSEGDTEAIVDMSVTPEFDLSQSGVYIIHTLVYDTSTLDLDIITIGVTTVSDVFGFTIEGGGNICADIDTFGATISVSAPNGGTISTNDTTEFCVGDNLEDIVEVDLMGVSGENMTWVITDESLNILSITESATFDFEEAGGGTCLIWHLSWDGDLSGAEVGLNAANLDGCFDLSNSILVTRNGVNGGTITTTNATEICVGDGLADNINVSLEGNEGTNTAWIITDQMGEILDLPTAPPFDFENTGGGVCLIWHLGYEDGIVGAEIGLSANEMEGCFSLSNFIQVTRFTEGSVCANVGVFNNISDAIEVDIYPNPASDLLGIKFELKHSIDQMNLRIYDMQGAIIIEKYYSTMTGTFQENFDISKLAEGQYMIHITNNEGYISQSFIKLK